MNIGEFSEPLDSENNEGLVEHRGELTNKCQRKATGGSSC